MSIARRMLSGTLVNTAVIAFYAILQMLSVPILTAAWGVTGFGVWSMMTTIPIYFALTDLGFASAATSDMTMQAAKGEHSQVLRTFQSVWLLLGGISLLVIALAAAILGISLMVPAQIGGWLSSYAAVLFVLVVYAAAGLMGRVVLAGYQATGHYSVGTFLYHGLIFIEGLTSLAVASLGGNFLTSALILLIFRIFNSTMLYCYMRRRISWLYLGFGEASTQELRRLFKPAIAAMAIPTALALNLQGMVLVVGAVLSPASVAMFIPVRTVSRVAIQIVGTINRATMPELSAVAMQENRKTLAKIVCINLASVMLILVPAAIVFAIYGSSFVNVWTRGHVQPDRTFVVLTATAMILHGFWFYGSNLLLASNSHTELASTLLIAAIGSSILAIPAASMFGLNGVACILILSELICLFRVVQISSRRKLLRRSDLQELRLNRSLPAT